MINIRSVTVGPLGVNCYIVTDEATAKTAVIDPGEYSSQLESALADAGFSNIEYILLTHGHFDHIGGVKKLRERTGGSAKIAIHTTDAAILDDDMRNLSLMFFGAPLADKFTPDLLLSDGDKLHLGESSFTVIHTPGHTAGSVCFVCENSIFSGDTLFRRSAGRTDFPTGSLKKLQESLFKLAALKGNFNVYPGHDSVTTLDEERAENPYLSRDI